MGIAVSEPNFPNRTFAVMDNLPFLERLPDESADLISIDPPFGKMESFRRPAKPPITRDEKAEERDLFLAHGLSLADEQQQKRLMVEGGSLVDDIFTWDNDVSGNRSHKAFYDRIAVAEAGSMARRVHRVIEATRETVGDNQAAYICFMAVRLVHCYRVLKPTPSAGGRCSRTARPCSLSFECLWGERTAEAARSPDRIVRQSDCQRGRRAAPRHPRRA